MGNPKKEMELDIIIGCKLPRSFRQKPGMVLHVSGNVSI
jgi:hypothetical protein